MLAAAPSPEALALSPLIGWLLLACGIAAGVLLIVGREGWRRWWLGLEDPRPLALFRIAFALLVLVDITSLGEHLPFLFSDEGMLSADDAQELFAARQFAGYGDGHAGDPRGFFGIDGVLQLLRGNAFSLLYFWDSPTALTLHLAAYIVACLALALGLWTRVAAFVGFVLFNSFLYRNEVFWEGTELVLRCLFFYLLLGRSGHALSVDNWLRCRRLRRAGRLSAPGGPGEGAGAPPSADQPAGLEAIYRRIPAWPRRLMTLQIAAIYLYTGAVKNGPIWGAGDALYYALNLDHFYRFYPQALAAALGLNLFRLMTWVTHLWEILFPLVIVGQVIRWRWRAALPATGALARRVAAIAWITLGLAALAILEVALPVHVPADTQPAALLAIQVACAVAWIAGMAALAGLTRRLGRGPLDLGRRTITREALVGWLLGRRVWLTLGVIFHLHLMVLMSIGVFQPIMLAATLLFLDGDEVRALLRRLGLGRRGATIPAAAPRPDRAPDPAPLPLAALVAALAVAVVGVLVAVASGGAIGWRGFGAAILGGLLVLVLVRLRRRPAPPIAADAAAFTFAYGPLGRLLIGALVLVQIVGVALWLVPDKGTTAAFRGPARAVFQPWLALTQTTQSWGMFAPNPPTANAFLKIELTRPNGQVVDLRTDVYAPENMPIPLWGYDRIRKINRRVLTDGARYRPWIARYQCRRWALEHGGELPREVRLIRLTYPIPPPEELARSGPYVPAERLRTHGREHLVHREACPETIAGQPSDALRARYGLPPAPPGSVHPNAKRRLSAWARRVSRTRLGPSTPEM